MDEVTEGDRHAHPPPAHLLASSSTHNGYEMQDSYKDLKDGDDDGHGHGQVIAVPAIHADQLVRHDALPPNVDAGRGEEVLPGSSPWRTRRKSGWKQRLSVGLGLDDTIDHDASTIPLAWMAMLTGLVDGAIYSRAEIWTGFQTGNTVQVALGITTYIFPRISGSIPRTPLLLLLRSLSLLAFFLAGIVGARLGKRCGHTRRSWLVASSIVQSALMFGAAGILWSRPEGEELTYRWWPGVIILIASSMGMQSILAQKIASPVFSTSVAFTATLTQMAADPNLFACSTSLPSPLSLFSSRQLPVSTKGAGGNDPAEGSKAFWGDESVRGRDLRLLALLSLAFGGGVAQSLLEVQAGIGLRGTVMVAAGCKGFLAVLWFVPHAKGKRSR